MREIRTSGLMRGRDLPSLLYNPSILGQFITANGDQPLTAKPAANRSQSSSLAVRRAPRSYVDYFVGQLHGGDDVKHVRRFSHLFPVQEIEVSQACAANQDGEALFLIVLQHIQNF